MAVTVAASPHQLQAGQRLGQPRRQAHPADDPAQRRVLLHLHQGAHLQARLPPGGRGGPRGGRGRRGRGLRLLAHHRLDGQREVAVTHVVHGPRLPVQAEGQRVELVVAGQGGGGGGRGSGGRRRRVEVRGRLRERLGRVLANWRREDGRAS